MGWSVSIMRDWINAWIIPSKSSTFITAQIVGSVDWKKTAPNGHGLKVTNTSLNWLLFK